MVEPVKQPDPCCVGVFRLHASTTLDDLTREFSVVGHVVKRFMLMDRSADANGVFKSYAFVTFSTPGEALKAIEVMNGTTLLGGGRPISVKQSETVPHWEREIPAPPRRRPRAPLPPRRTRVCNARCYKVYVAGIPGDASEDEILRELEGLRRRL